MSELQGIARLKIHDAKLEEFKRLAVMCIESVRARDSGTLQYDWFFSDGYPECMVHGSIVTPTIFLSMSLISAIR